MGSTVIDQFQYVTLIVLYIYVHMVTYVYHILLFHLQVLHDIIIENYKLL